MINIKIDYDLYIYVHSESVLTIVLCVRRLWWKFCITTAHVQRHSITTVTDKILGASFFPKTSF